MKKDIRKIIGITTVVSSIALEIAAFVSALPITKYRAQYHKSLNESEDNKDKLAKTRNKTIALGTTAVALAIVGVKLNHKKNVEEAVDAEPEVTEEKLFEEPKEELKEEPKEELKEESKEDLNEDSENNLKEEPKENTGEILKKETGKETENVSKKDKWKCVECDHENDGEKKVCSYCGTLRSDILSQALREW